MDHPEGAGKTGDARLGFDSRVRLEFHGSKISSDGGLLLFRELDDVLGLHDIAGGLLRDTRTGHNRLHTLVGLLRQSVFGRSVFVNKVVRFDHAASLILGASSARSGFSHTGPAGCQLRACSDQRAGLAARAFS